MKPAPIIAVVDDDASVRKALRRLLHSAGMEVRLYDSALDYLGAQPHPDAEVVITDVRMPGMNGLELQQRLHESFPALPVIVVTAYETPSAREQAMANGAVAFLRKPFEGRALLQAVSTALSTTRRAAAAAGE